MFSPRLFPVCRSYPSIEVALGHTGYGAPGRSGSTPRVVTAIPVGFFQTLPLPSFEMELMVFPEGLLAVLVLHSTYSHYIPVF